MLSHTTFRVEWRKQTPLNTYQCVNAMVVGSISIWGHEIYLFDPYSKIAVGSETHFCKFVESREWSVLARAFFCLSYYMRDIYIHVYREISLSFDTNITINTSIFL